MKTWLYAAGILITAALWYKNGARDAYTRGFHDGVEATIAEVDRQSHWGR